MTSLPRITRSTAPPAAGMVHLGPGAFFRAFIAPYTNEAMGAGSEYGKDWGIIAVSLKSPTAREACKRALMGGHNCQPTPRHLSLRTKATTTDGDVGVYQRVITLTFKDELSKEAITNYLQPVIKEQGEAYGLIAMTCARINELSVVDTYYWPDYDTFEKAKNEYAGKFVEATRKAGAKVDIKEAYVYRAWFDGTDDMRSLTNF